MHPSQIYDWANVGLIVSLVLGVVSTCVLVYAGKAKEEIAKRESTAADLRIAELGESTASLMKEVAEANARASEAKLKLEQLRAPRQIPVESAKEISGRLKQFAGQQFSALLPPAGIDTEAFWGQLARLLESAGWERSVPDGLVAGDPPAGIALNAAPGVYVGIAPTRRLEVNPAMAAQALVNELRALGIAADFGYDHEAEASPLGIRIVIGLKPN